MERIETPAMIDSSTQLESYYQSKYEYYLAMATEAKENKERVGLLLLDLDRDVSYPDNSNASGLNDERLHNGSASHRSLDCERVILELPQAKPKPESSPPAVVDEERETPVRVEQMKKWTLDLFKAMSVIELVSNSDSGKALHQNYLHHLLNREFEQRLSVELVELYLEEAIRRGYLEPDEFDNNCYIAKSKSETFGEQNKNTATEKATTEILSGGRNNKPYDLPSSDKLKPTLLETIEGYIALYRPKRFSIEDVVNYLYPQSVQSDWNQVQRNKVSASISNVLGRKAYLGKHWSRIKPGVYRPRV